MDTPIDKMKYSKELDYNCILRNIEMTNQETHIDPIQNLIDFFEDKWRDDVMANELRALLKHKFNKLLSNGMVD